MQNGEAGPTAAPIVVTASEVPTPPPCCQQAHERGYRRGYRDGYTYACWDLVRALRVADRLWSQVETFFQTQLRPWVQRAYHTTSTRLSREGGPRLRLGTRSR